jgi:hypothetical protein
MMPTNMIILFLGIESEHEHHRVIMYYIQTKATNHLPYFGHLPLNTYLSVVCIAAVATELGDIKIYLFL